MRFARFLSGGFITAIEVNPPERKLAKCTSVHCTALAPSDLLLPDNYSDFTRLCHMYNSLLFIPILTFLFSTQILKVAGKYCSYQNIIVLIFDAKNSS